MKIKEGQQVMQAIDKIHSIKFRGQDVLIHDDHSIKIPPTINICYSLSELVEIRYEHKGQNRTVKVKLRYRPNIDSLHEILTLINSSICISKQDGIVNLETSVDNLRQIENPLFNKCFTQVTLSNRPSSSSSKLEGEVNSLGRVYNGSLVTVSLVLNIENKDNMQTVYQGDDLSKRRHCNEAKSLNLMSMVIIAGATIGIVVILVVVVTIICIRSCNRQWNWSHYKHKQEGKSPEDSSEGEYLGDSRAVRDPRMISSPLETEYENVEDLVRGSAKPTF